MLLCFISATFWQCQKEELETIESSKQGKLNLWVVPGEKAFNESKQLQERVTSLKRKNTAARLTSTIYNFSIEEEHVQIIIGDDYTQYTFNVERENPTPNLLENYVCKIYTDGEVFQYLMGYPYTIGQNGISYQMQNSTIQVINDENIVVTTAGRGFPPGCVPEFLYEVLTYECTNYPCTGDGHSIHQNCDCDNITCNRAYTYCSWVTTAVYGGCGGGGSTGGDGGFTPPAGGGGTPGTTTPVDPVVTVPFGNINNIKDCQELNLNSQDSIFRQRMQTLKDAVPGDVEKSFGTYNASSLNPAGSNPTCGNVFSGYSQGAANIALNPLLKTIAHNHLKNPVHKHIGTFAPEDLIALANVMTNSEDIYSPITQEEITAYLICHEGNYAVKVKDSQKLLNFAVAYANITSFKDIIDNFYKRNKIQHGKLKQDQNFGFLKLLKEFDIGIEYYEADENFQNWQKLELNSSGNNIVKKPC